MRLMSTKWTTITTIETTETETLPTDETISGDEITANNERLREYVSRIKKISTAVREQLASEDGDFQDMDNANKRDKWLEKFIDALYDNRCFVDLSLDIMDAVAERFSLIAAPGEFLSRAWVGQTFGDMRKRTVVPS